MSIRGTNIMLTAYKTWHYAPLAILVVSGLSTAISAQLISFSYSQTDKTTGGGTFSGTVDGISSPAKCRWPRFLKMIRVTLKCPRA